jgi:aspartyl-tRNA(Asn)/glutamyl-tRNA(Gln) amidotransferase subunit C
VALSTDEVARLAALARVDLSPEELAKLAPQLDVILDAVARVSEIAGDDIKPSSHAFEITNVFRPDEVRPSISQEAALSGAPAEEDGKFRVPRILEED